MENPGHTLIFYKPGQTYLTWTKFDLNDPDDPTQFQPLLVLYKGMNDVFDNLRLTYVIAFTLFYIQSNGEQETTEVL